MPTTRHFVTYIVVDNPTLANYKEEYKLALNCLDHMILQQERKGGHKFCYKLNDREIIQCQLDMNIPRLFGQNVPRYPRPGKTMQEIAALA